MLEALIAGVLVAVAAMALARHVRHEADPEEGACADCSERCSARDQCPLVAVTKRDDEAGR